MAPIDGEAKAPAAAINGPLVAECSFRHNPCGIVVLRTGHSAVVFVRIFRLPHLQSLATRRSGGVSVNSSPAWGSLLTELYWTQKPKLNSAFEGLLECDMNISRSARSRASDSQNHLREFLTAERTRESSFPRILSVADSDFLGGSFARHTKNWTLPMPNVLIEIQVRQGRDDEHVGRKSP